MKKEKKEGLALALRQRPPRTLHETPPMMVNDISHLFFSKMRSMEPEGALSQHSARTILRLLFHKDGMRQHELACAAHLSAPTVSAVLRRMESEGLIVRRNYEHDARAVGVYLTEYGRRQNEAVLDMLHGLDEVLMRGFSLEETEQLEKMLSRMRENLLRDMRGEIEEDRE